MMEGKTEYSLAVYDYPNISGVRLISQEEFEKYSKYITRITKVSNDEKLFKIIELNYADFKVKLNKHISKYNENPKADFFEFEHVFIDINRLILNFLSATRSFLDHTETRLKREFGKKSDEISLFQNLTSQAYDNNFSYRFLYKSMLGNLKAQKIIAKNRESVYLGNSPKSTRYANEICSSH